MKPQQDLAADDFIDSSHPDVQALAARVTVSTAGSVTRAVKAQCATRFSTTPYYAGDARS